MATLSEHRIDIFVKNCVGQIVFDLTCFDLGNSVGCTTLYSESGVERVNKSHKIFFVFNSSKKRTDFFLNSFPTL